LILPRTLQYIAAAPGFQLLTLTTKSPLEAYEDEAETNYSLEPCRQLLPTAAITITFSSVFTNLCFPTAIAAALRNDADIIPCPADHE
jgi:hypothetical protein